MLHSCWGQRGVGDFIVTASFQKARRPQSCIVPDVMQGSLGTTARSGVVRCSLGEIRGGQRIRVYPGAGRGRGELNSSVSSTLDAAVAELLPSARMRSWLQGMPRSFVFIEAFRAASAQKRERRVRTGSESTST